MFFISLPTRPFRILCLLYGILAFLCAGLLLSIATMASIHKFVLVPACTVPYFRTTEFCRVICSTNHTLTTSPAVLVTKFLSPITSNLCQYSPFSRLSLCSVNDRPMISTPSAFDQVPAGLEDQFHAFKHLLAGSSAAPRFGRDIREVVLSLDDMIILLRGTSFRRKAAVIAQLLSIRQSSRESARRLQKYTARLMSSINLILTASGYAVEVAESVTSQQKSFLAIPTKWMSFWMSPTSKGERQIQEAFLHTIKTFEILSRDLYHLNGETQDSISILDDQVEVLTDLIYDSALVDANKELGDVLSRFWTQLGGHRTLLSGAKDRVSKLKKVGEGTKLMRSFVVDVQLHLEKLQIGAEELRSQAAEPLLLDGPIPIANVIQSLRDGCQLLKKEVWNVVPLLE